MSITAIIQIQPLNAITLQSAIALVDSTFPKQPFLEQARFSLPLSLQSNNFSRLVWRISGLKFLQYWVITAPTGEVIGVSGIYIWKSQPRTAWLGWTCLDPSYRRQGLGGRLLRVAISHAQSWNCRWLQVYTGSDYPEASRFYKKYGFRKVDFATKRGAITYWRRLEAV